MLTQLVQSVADFKGKSALYKFRRVESNCLTFKRR